MAVDDRHSDKTFGMSTLFHCPTCTAKYEIVRVEAPPGPTTDREIVCVACGGPLQDREGKFLLNGALTAKVKIKTTFSGGDVKTNSIVSLLLAQPPVG